MKSLLKCPQGGSLTLRSSKYESCQTKVAVGFASPVIASGSGKQGWLKTRTAAPPGLRTR